jgi:hypothetical protein
VQLVPAARLVPQIFCVRLNCALTVTVRELAAKLPVLLIVTVCAGLACPGISAGKLNCAGLTLRPVVTVPVPFRATLTGVTPSVEEEITSAAALPPAAAGVNVTCTVQLLPFASIAPHVVVPAAKLLAPSPVR